MTCDRPICRDYCTESYCAEADSKGSYEAGLRALALEIKTGKRVWFLDPRACLFAPWDEPHRYRTMAQVIAEERAASSKTCGLNGQRKEAYPYADE